MKWLPVLGAMATLSVVAPLAAAPPDAAPAAAQDSDHRMRVKIAVKDFKRSIDFYGILGMKPGFKHSEAQIELNWPGEMSGIMMVNDPTGAVGAVPVDTYLMITIPDVKAVADQLRNAGFADIGEPTNLGPATMLKIKDPDGNKVELLSTKLKQPR